MAFKKTKPVETVAQVEEVQPTKAIKHLGAVCANCDHHAEDGQCLLAAMAGQPMHITSHAGVLITADEFGCNQFEGKV